MYGNEIADPNKILARNSEKFYTHSLYTAKYEDIALEFTKIIKEFIKPGWVWYKNLQKFNFCYKNIYDTDISSFRDVYYNYGVLFDENSNKIMDERIHSCIDEIIDEFREDTELFYWFDICYIINTNNLPIHVRLGNVQPEYLDWEKYMFRSDVQFAALVKFSDKRSVSFPPLFSNQFRKKTIYNQIYNLCTDGEVSLSEYDNKMRYVPQSRIFQITDSKCTILDCSFYDDVNNVVNPCRTETILFI